MSTVDASLINVPFVERTTLYPLNTFYMSRTSNSSSVSRVSWFVQNPASNAYLDNEAYIEYTVTISDIQVGSSSAPGFDTGFTWKQQMLGIVTGSTSSDPEAESTRSARTGVPGWSICPREGPMMAKAMQSVTLNLNGTVLNTEPIQTIEQQNIFYASKFETDNIFSLSGGKLDSGGCGQMCRSRMPKTMWNSSEAVNTYNPACNLYPVGVAATSVAGCPQLAIYQWDCPTVPFPSGGAFPTTPQGTAFTLGDFEQYIYNMAPLWPTAPDCESMNPGYDSRLNSFLWRLRAFTATSTTEPTLASGFKVWLPSAGSTFTMKIWERIPIQPFLFYENRDGRRSIPNIKQFDLSINWTANATKHLFMTTLYNFAQNSDSNTPDPTIDYYTEAPKLHLKWYVPPPGFSIPPQISTRIQELNIFPQALDAGDTAASTSVSLTFTEANLPTGVGFQAFNNNIRLLQMPDYLMIFVRTQAGQIPNRWDPSTYPLSITQLSISIDGDAGKILSASAGELYAMFVKNSFYAQEHRISFMSWLKKRCLCLITPRDMGVRFGSGINMPITLDVQAQVVNLWFPFDDHSAQEAAIARSATQWQYTGVAAQPGSIVNDSSPLSSQVYELVVVAVYDKYELLLTADGGSARRLQQVPPDGPGGTNVGLPNNAALGDVL